MNSYLNYIIIVTFINGGENSTTINREVTNNVASLFC